MPQPAGALEHAKTIAHGEGVDKPLMIFPYGVSRNKIERAIHNLRVNASIARKWDDADVVLTLKTLERKESAEAQADRGGKRADLLDQDQHDDADSVRLARRLQPRLDRSRRDRDARGRGSHLSGPADSRAVELSPQTSYVRRMQHQLAEKYRLQSRSTGLEPNRRVRIFKVAD